MRSDICPPELPARIEADDDGEVKCVVLAYGFEEAKRALRPFSSGIVGSYPFISAFGAKVRVHDLEDLRRLPCVRAVASHATVSCSALPAGLQATGQKLHSPRRRGEHVRVAVIDTGACPHLDFTLPVDRMAHFSDFVSGRTEPYDDNGHGSAVSGLICGSGVLSGGEHRGSAPWSDLIALKAMDARGEGSAFHILEAMQWIYDNRERFNIRVACMSFGTNSVRGDDPLVMGAEALWRSGVTVVTSAGNSGPKAGTVTSPGCCPEIITVGAAERSGTGYRVASFSSRSPARDDVPLKPELLARGVDVPCCGVKERYVTLSGTSMAAPVVAGYAADLISRDPRLTPDRVKELLVSSAVPVSGPKNAVGYGFALPPPR